MIDLLGWAVAQTDQDKAHAKRQQAEAGANALQGAKSAPLTQVYHIYADDAGCSQRTSHADNDAELTFCDHGAHYITASDACNSKPRYAYLM